MYTNNPTGESITLDTVAEICKSYQGIVAVDEAYIEFSDMPSAIACLINIVTWSSCEHFLRLMRWRV